MLTLTCNPATRLRRRLLLQQFQRNRPAPGVCVVVPGEMWAENLRTRLTRDTGVLRADAVLSNAEFSNLLLPPTRRLIAGSTELLSIVQSILIQNPGKYSILAGEGSVPPAAGVMRRIVDAILQISRAAEEPDQPGRARLSARERQLHLLTEELHSRLHAGGAVFESVDVNQRWLQLTDKDFAAALPGINSVVFDGFDSFDNGQLLAMRRVRDFTRESFVLLDYDPVEDSERYPHFNSVYERLYDLADKHEFELEDSDDFALDGDAAEEDDTSGEPGTEHGSVTPAVLMVYPVSRSAEVRAVAAWLRNQVDLSMRNAGTFACEDFALCFPARSVYAPMLESTFREYGLPLAAASTHRVVGHPVWEFVEMFRNGVSKRASFAALRKLLKSPFLDICARMGHTSDLPMGVVTGLGPALDRLRINEGIGSAGQKLITDLQQHIKTLQYRVKAGTVEAGDDDRRAFRLQRDLEDYRRLEQVLECCLTALRRFMGRKPIDQWSDLIIELLSPIPAAVESTTGGQHPHTADLERLMRDAILACMKRLESVQSLLTQDHISFTQFVSYLRLMLQQETVSFRNQASGGFALVSPEELAGCNARVVIMGGLVDGEFPAHRRREAQLLQGDQHVMNQSRMLSHQRYLFDRALTSAVDQVILLSPRSEDGSALLQSQFVEELFAGPTPPRVAGSEEFPGDAVSPFNSSSRVIELLATRVCSGFDDSLRTTPNTESRIGQLPEPLYSMLWNVAWSTCANRERTREDVCGYFDGMIADPALLKYLQKRAEKHVHSVSHMDLLVQCPFHYFANRLLELQDPREEDDLIAPNRMGELVHLILFRFYTDWTARAGGPIVPSNLAEATGILLGHSQKAVDDAPLSRFNRDLLTRKFWGHVVQPVAGSPIPGLQSRRGYQGIFPGFLQLELERSQNGQGALTPQFFEIAFGLPPRRGQAADEHSRTEPVELILDDGQRLRLRGRADRIDTSSSLFSIVDYKTGSSPSIADQTAGYRVQIPVYLMAFEKLFQDQDVNLQPAGGVFYILKPKRAETRGQFYRATFKAESGLRPRIRYLTEESYAEAMSRVRRRIADGLTRIREGRFHVTLAPERIACAVCDQAAVCRKDLARARRVVPKIPAS